LLPEAGVGILCPPATPGRRTTVPGLRTWEALGVVTQFGVTCAVSVGLGVLVGSWIDSRLGTGIVFTLLLALGAMIAAVTSTLQLLKVIARRQKAQQDEARES
jgi:hypothetical protein